MSIMYVYVIQADVWTDWEAEHFQLS